MSGIVGIFRRDGTQVAGDELRSMTDFLAYRGPDSQNIWLGGDIGFGHALLNTTSQESSGQKQPTSIGSVWITADVSLDSKADLIRKLRASGRIIENDPCDAALILHAYTAWGHECV